MCTITGRDGTPAELLRDSVREEPPQGDAAGGGESLDAPEGDIR